MEDLFSLKYGIAGVCILLTLQSLMKMAEFLWGLREKKDSVSEAAIKELTLAMEANTKEIHLLKTAVGELPKFKKDVRRFYTAIKTLAGDEWPDIRKELLEDEAVG